MPPDRRQCLWAVQTYLMVRRSRWLLTMMAIIAVVVAGWGSFELPTPTATAGEGATVPLWRLLAVWAASLPVLTLVSPMEELEAAAGPPYHRLRAVVLGGAFAVSAAGILTAAAVGVDPAVAPPAVRALLAWFGLALVSGRVLGWNYSWALPLAALCVLLYWGRTGTQDYRWWEFTAQPIAHLPSMLLAGSLFAAGITAYSLSPWRIRVVSSTHRRSTARPRRAGARAVGR